jgi:hypothetical protein
MVNFKGDNHGDFSTIGKPLIGWPKKVDHYKQQTGRRAVPLARGGDRQSKIFRGIT